MFISYVVSEWERMGSSSRQLRQNTCLCFSLLLGARAQIPPVSPRKKPGETREKERDTNNQAAIRKPVCPRVPADFPYKCSSEKLPADSRFSQILTVSPSWLLQRSSDREVSTAVSVYVRGSVYVRALSEWGRVFVWKRS